MTRKTIIIGALAAVTLLTSQVQVAAFPMVKSEHPAPEGSEEGYCYDFDDQAKVKKCLDFMHAEDEAREKMCRESDDQERVQKCLEYVHEESAKKAEQRAEEMRHLQDQYKREELHRLLDPGNCSRLLDKDDYVNYEACVRFHNGLPH